MWFYSQTSGELYHDSEFIGTGYAGNGAGLNNPAEQAVPNVGPVPQGVYRIGPAFDDQQTGPISMRLEPEPGTDTFGRSGFLAHGDDSAHNHSASHGCIVLGHDVRIRVAMSGDHILTVTA